MLLHSVYSLFFFFNDTATTEIYTLSLHDALPISTRSSRRWCAGSGRRSGSPTARSCSPPRARTRVAWWRSEEHTSELQSRLHLVCRLLLEKKKNKKTQLMYIKARRRQAGHISRTT